jgi:hypothetical protein
VRGLLQLRHRPCVRGGVIGAAHKPGNGVLTMSRLELVRGQGNRYTLPVHSPVGSVDWDLSPLDFCVRPLGSADTPNEAEDLLDRSTHVPPGGMRFVDDDLVEVVIGADETRRLAALADAVDWSLDLRLGSFNVYVLGFGRLDVTPAAGTPHTGTVTPVEVEHPPSI